MRAAFESCLRSLTAVAAVGLWATCAQPAAAQMLTETLARAYATNPTLRAARAELGAAVAEIPPVIGDQLADSGRLVAVVKGDPGMGRATLMQRNGGVISSRILFDASAPMLPGFEIEPGFVF